MFGYTTVSDNPTMRVLGFERSEWILGSFKQTMGMGVPMRVFRPATEIEKRAFRAEEADHHPLGSGSVAELRIKANIQWQARLKEATEEIEREKEEPAAAAAASAVLSDDIRLAIIVDGDWSSPRYAKCNAGTLLREVFNRKGISRVTAIQGIPGFDPLAVDTIEKSMAQLGLVEPHTEHRIRVTTNQF